jgi:asparagine synthase (glutamine-hydrolysing)
VNATISLSGGLDSTTLAACAVSLRKVNLAKNNAELRSVSVDFLPLFADQETALASEFARALNLPCDLLHLGEYLPYQGWSDLPLPEPLADPYALLPLLQSRHMAERSRVMFSGMGCDELLRLQAYPYLKYLTTTGRPLAAASAVFRYMLAEKKLPPLGAGIRTGLLALAGKKRNDFFYPPWIKPEFARRLQLEERWREFSAIANSPHPYNPRGYLDMNDLSVGSILENSDATWTGCNAELRIPFLDRRLVRFVLRLPPIPWAMDKYLIRRSQTGILPDAIRLRPKTPVLHDVLLHQIAAKKWSPLQLDMSPGILETVVDWPLLMNVLSRSIDESLYLHLRPFSLLYWLKSVEKHHSIQ